MTTIADITVVVWYTIVFLGAAIVIVAASIFGYFEIRGLIQDIKNDRRDAKILRNAEDFRSDFT